MASSRFTLKWLTKFRAKTTNPKFQCPNPTSQLKRGNHNAAWRKIAGRKIYFRSLWEFRYGLYLQYQKEQGIIKDWEHEPQTFWFDKIKRGVKSYLPDFRVLRLNGTHYWVEVKGWLDPKSKTKMRRFKRYYPKEHLELVTSPWFNQNQKALKLLIKEWV